MVPPPTPTMGESILLLLQVDTMAVVQEVAVVAQVAASVEVAIDNWTSQ